MDRAAPLKKRASPSARRHPAARARARLRVDIVTLFPEMFEGPLDASIVGRARAAGLEEVGFVNPRDFATDRRRTVDDRPFGGGAGMVLLAEPVFQALKRVRRAGSLVVHLSPQGRRFDQGLARELASRRHLVLVCGHYEGIDERALDYVDLELSIGDYVLTGGELPAMVVVDALTRLVPGVLAKEGATDRESFTEALLDFPQFTRPRVWRRRAVPDVLLSGDHRRIDAWRRAAQREATRRKRPDLLRRDLEKARTHG
ncbi:MAG: tRNA (guanosine(37)-N1)-methyltransferase TrmD [Elusimicrobia bacterium]|nr:tRNA (guanosine(37)-N1)-methyltransferase TrmD [Elusimicrobiota bacterium]